MKKNIQFIANTNQFILKNLILSVFIANVFELNSYAQQNPNYETVVVEKSFSTSSKTIINQQQIENSKAPNMAALLATQANISITNSPFQPNSLFVRGGDSSQVLIIIDDIPVYDSSTTQRSFNLNSINIRSVKKVTIIKGSQSVWYGGQALSAVIKIETLSALSKGINKLEIGAGAQNNKFILGDISKNVTNSSNELFFRGQFQTQSSDSPVSDSTYKYKKRNQNMEVGYFSSEDSVWFIKANSYSDRNENVTGFSYTDFKAADAEGYIITNDSQQMIFSYKDSSIAIKPMVSIGFINSHRLYSFEQNQYNPAEQNQEYKGLVIPIRGELRLINTNDLRWDIGASYIKESLLYEEFKSEIANNFNEIRGVFTKAEFDLTPDFHIQIGSRVESDTLSGKRSETSTEAAKNSFVGTYHLGFEFEKFKLETSTGYKLPSLYQLFSNKGNSNINPERARTYSVTYGNNLSEIADYSFTIFETHIDDLIVARGNPLQYYNIGRTITKGVESNFNWQMDNQQKLGFAVGYQEPRDIETGKWLAKRPLKSASILYTNILEHSRLTMELNARGERDDVKSSSATVRLPGYALLNASYLFTLKNKNEIFFRGDNLTNQTYLESYGYEVHGINFQLGSVLYF